MNRQWKIIYYTTRTGECPFEQFIQVCNNRNRARVLALLSILEERGPNLPRPYADLLEDGIHELRLKLSGKQIRGLYFFCYRNFIVFTHAFPKTTRKVPKAELSTAKKYRKDFLQRFSEEDLREGYDENI